MITFAIIEVEDGLTVVEVPPSVEPAIVAEQNHGVLVDAGPYDTYEAACDALTNLEAAGERRE